MIARVAIIAVVVGAAGGVAEAYPQFQLSRDQTCTGCHVSPVGGGLLNENGYSVAEGISQFGTQPEFFYQDKVSTGNVVFGGDLRAAGGYLKYGGDEDAAVYAFPMQIEAYARFTVGSFSLHLTGGLRKSQELIDALPPDQEDIQGASDTRDFTFLWSREHYLTWQSRPGEGTGVFVRAGRFMPAFGLRFAEHPMYTRRYGGTQLFADTYGLALHVIEPKYEIHATGFVEDYAIDPVEHANGGALYGEYRASESLQLGAGVMYKSFTNGEPLLSDEIDSDSRELRFTVTNKTYLTGLELLLSTEIQFVNLVVDEVQRSADSEVGGAPKGFVGNLVASRMLGDFLLLDVGVGHFDPNYRIGGLDRNCVDLNLHWFTTSHLEVILNGRYELNGFGDSEPGIYSLLQVHYRL